MNNLEKVQEIHKRLNPSCVMEVFGVPNEPKYPSRKADLSRYNKQMKELPQKITKAVQILGTQLIRAYEIDGDNIRKMTLREIKKRIKVEMQVFGDYTLLDMSAEYTPAEKPRKEMK